VAVTLERFEHYALGRPYHAALVDLRGRSSRHGHRDYYEVMAVVAGAGEQELGPGSGSSGDRSQQLRPGDLVLIRPRDQHLIVGPVRFYNIAFPATGWRAFVNLAGVDRSWDADQQPPQRRLSDDRAERSCAAILERFHGVPTDLDLIRFWTDIIPLLDSPAADPAPPPGPADWLVAACAAMHREEDLRDGVRRLLELANVSPAHLSRSMRQHYGTTPTAFVTDLRMRHAATLLGTTTRPITEIAYACGFASPSYFTRCFRTEHKVTPREFRRAARRAFVP